MKEFTSQTGGRFTYIDDFLNLQELALAFAEIFSDCDNFIVSGCEVSGNSISEGLVYLNGKLRKVEAVSSVSGGWPQYIYEVNENKNVPYASGGEKVGRAEWGAAIGKTVPTTKTVLTGAVPKAIQLTSTGGVRMKDAWLGKYALVTNPSAGSQSVKGHVDLETLSVSGEVRGTSRYILETGGTSGSIYISGPNLIFERLSNGKKVQLLMNETSCQVTVNGTVIAVISDSAVTFNKALSAVQGSFGNVKVAGNAIYNGSVASNMGEVQINMVGFNGLTNYYRTTKIGDGKGHPVLTIIGSSKSAQLNGDLMITSTSGVPVVFKSAKLRSDKNLVEYVTWKDSEGVETARFGFTDASNYNVTIENIIGDISIEGANYVDIGPIIKEGGVALKDRYADKQQTKDSLDLKANLKDVYPKTSTYSSEECHKKFASKNDGFGQFITVSNTAEVLCGQIGAVRESNLKDYVKKDQFLSDMASSEEAKAQIRKNIGAASDTQKDTGWINIPGTSLYVRQIGDIVSIQGTLTITHDGTVFTLPNQIQAPRYDVGYDAPLSNEHSWGCEIKAGKKVCTVSRCNSKSNHGLTTPILITYMV